MSRAMKDDSPIKPYETTTDRPGFLDGNSRVSLLGPMLGDWRDPDPVIPPDLHLVKPAKADAEGNVTCIYCSVKVPWNLATMVGSDGYSCGKHGTVIQTHSELQNVKLERPMWPWAVGIAAVIAGAGYLIWHSYTSNKREELEDQFPVAATDAQQDILAKNAARW